MRIVLCPLEELPPGSARTVRSGDLEVAVFNVAGELFALDNACAHTGGPLVDGLVHDGAVTCPRHWWRFDLATGQRRGAAHICQRAFPVAIVDGEVTVDLPAPQPSVGMRELLLRHAAEWIATHQGTEEELE